MVAGSLTLFEDSHKESRFQYLQPLPDGKFAGQQSYVGCNTGHLFADVCGSGGTGLPLQGLENVGTSKCDHHPCSTFHALVSAPHC